MTELVRLLRRHGVRGSSSQHKRRLEVNDN